MSANFRLNAKNLFLTYPNCDLSPQAAGEILIDKIKQLSYLKVVTEKHQSGELHLHAYCQLKSKCNFKKPTCLDLNEFHGNYAAARGSYKQISEYMSKDPVADFEFGIPDESAGDRSAEVKSGILARKEKNEKILTCKLKDLVDEGEISIMHYVQVKKAKQQYEMDNKQNGVYIKERKKYWVIGRPGAGKSRLFRALDPHLYSKPLNKWWDGYTGQCSVLIDDFDHLGKCLSHYIKIWADMYSFLGEQKGATVVCEYKNFYISSNYWPQQIWPEEEDKELTIAIMRRFKIIHIDDIIAKYHLDSDKDDDWATFGIDLDSFN